MAFHIGEKVIVIKKGCDNTGKKGRVIAEVKEDRRSYLSRIKTKKYIVQMKDDWGGFSKEELIETT